jgi:murein DD-endopeptidase MepM/ murein hydrolase activator NlpD
MGILEQITVIWLGSPRGTPLAPEHGAFRAVHMVIDALDPILGSVIATTPAMRSAKSSRTAFSGSLRDAHPSKKQSAPSQYFVKAGDTLSNIVAQQRRTAGLDASNKAVYDAVRKVAAANGLKSPDRISVNQAIDLSAALTHVKSSATTPKSAEDLLISETLLQQALLNPGRHHLETRNDQVAPPSPVTAKLAHAEHTDTANQMSPAIAKTPHSHTNPWDTLIAKPASLTSGFGARTDPFTGKDAQHEGIDLAVKKGTAIYPYMPGKVVFSGWQRGYGNVVIVDHGEGLQSLYGHNQKNFVKRGQSVSEQTKIANVGSTGRATGNHLHFEVRKDGQAVDPMPFLENDSIQVALAF